MKKKSILILFVLCVPLFSWAQNSMWHGTIKNEYVELNIVFHLGEKNTIDSPDQGAFDIPASVDSSYLAGLKINIPSIAACFTGIHFRDKIYGTFTQNGQNYPLTLDPGDIKYNRPQTPKPPFDYEIKHTVFNNGNITLAGTLSNPDASVAVLLVSGSGEQNRDEEIMGHKPFAVIANNLAKAGIASLRYDDRGCGESGGNAKSATTDTLARDAECGINYLRSLGYKKVGIIGHSEGGTIAMMLASKSNGPDFIVTLAGMSDRGDSTIFRQTYKQLELSGFTSTLAEDYAQQTLNLNISSKDPWVENFIKINPSTFISKITCPFLALNGGKDTQVIPEYNLYRIKDFVPQAETCLFPDLNHLFQHCDKGLPSEYNRIEETIAPEVLAYISDWICLKIGK